MHFLWRKAESYLSLHGYFSMGHFLFFSILPHMFEISICLDLEVKSYLSLERFGAVNNYEGPGLPLDNLLWSRKTLQYEECLTE